VTLVLTTEKDLPAAQRLAEELLSRRLVACVSWSSIRSRYRWQGSIETEQEVQLLLKTTPERIGPLRAALEQLHTYDTPEWLQWTAASSGAYGNWVQDELRNPNAPAPGVAEGSGNEGQAG